MTITFTKEQYNAIVTAISEGKAVIAANLRDAQRNGQDGMADLLTKWLANAEQAARTLSLGEIKFK